MATESAKAAFQGAKSISHRTHTRMRRNLSEVMSIFLWPRAASIINTYIRDVPMLQPPQEYAWERQLAANGECACTCACVGACMSMRTFVGSVSNYIAASDMKLIEAHALISSILALTTYMKTLTI